MAVTKSPKAKTSKGQRSLGSGQWNLLEKTLIGGNVTPSITKGVVRNLTEMLKYHNENHHSCANYQKADLGRWIQFVRSTAEKQAIFKYRW